MSEFTESTKLETEKSPEPEISAKNEVDQLAEVTEKIKLESTSATGETKEAVETAIPLSSESTQPTAESKQPEDAKLKTVKYRSLAARQTEHLSAGNYLFF